MKKSDFESYEFEIRFQPKKEEQPKDKETLKQMLLNAGKDKEKKPID